MAKDSITIRLQSDRIDGLEAEADEKGVTRSEYIRQILQQRHEIDNLEQEVQQLEERLESRENRIQELEEQLARRSQLEEKVDTLAKQQSDEENSDAPFFVRWYKWWQRRE